MTLEEIVYHIQSCRSCGHPIILNEPIRTMHVYAKGKGIILMREPKKYYKVGMIYGRDVFIPAEIYEQGGDTHESE